MTKQQEAVFQAAHPMPPFWEVRFALANPPAPGTFVLADLGGPLRNALFPAALDDDGFTTMVPPGHPLTHVIPGTRVSMLGPFGHGFDVAQPSKERLQPARLLLIAEAARLPPLLPLLDAAPSVALMIEAPTRALFPPLQRIPPTVELYLVTLDGSTGYLGPLESEAPPPSGLQRPGARLRELIAWTEHMCVVGDRARYPALAGIIRQVRLYPQSHFAQALVQVPMPCGVGACEICRVRPHATSRREYHACTDGPVFDLLDFAP
jgi:dihydroorotate dehydrogenase electron transfer subunit